MLERAIELTYAELFRLLNGQSVAKVVSVSDREHPKSQNGWLTANEYAVLEALATLILPSDHHGPGAAEAGVAAKIDRMLASTLSLQELYSMGLTACDQLARRRYQASFTSLAQSQQIELLSFIERARTKIYGSSRSLPDRARRKFWYWYYSGWLSLRPIVNFWIQLQVDVMTQFYSSQVAWNWLGYEGPPFPLGYITRAGRSPATEA